MLESRDIESVTRREGRWGFSKVYPWNGRIHAHAQCIVYMDPEDTRQMIDIPSRVCALAVARRRALCRVVFARASHGARIPTQYSKSVIRKTADTQWHAALENRTYVIYDRYRSWFASIPSAAPHPLRPGVKNSEQERPIPHGISFLKENEQGSNFLRGMVWYPRGPKGGGVWS